MEATEQDAIVSPEWCPVCGERRGPNYPYLIGSTTVGCKGCLKIWTIEELAAKVNAKDPRHG